VPWVGVSDIEPDHMGDEIHPETFQLGAGFAGIAPAGFATIGQQYHRGRIFRETQLLGGQSHRIGKRALPRGVSPCTNAPKRAVLPCSGCEISSMPPQSPLRLWP